LLGIGFVSAYRREPECAEDTCAPTSRRSAKIILWITVGVVGLLAAPNAPAPSAAAATGPMQQTDAAAAATTDATAVFMRAFLTALRRGTSLFAA